METDPDTVTAVAARLRAAGTVIGRERELELVFATVAAGRDLVLEGPPGTSKTTILKAITEQWGIPLVLVEGNADLTPPKLIGHHNPARVLQEDYNSDNFTEGPLVQSMRQGGFLYIEEINRAPEDTLNTLLTAMADRVITIPRFGSVQAGPTFRVIASMNPSDDVGTNRLSSSVADRLCRIALGYQGEESEREIVKLRTGAGAVPAGPLVEEIIEDAVALTRATRGHPDIRQGSSIRGAIDCAMIANQLTSIRGVTAAASPAFPDVMYDAIILALSGRVHVDDAADTTPERILRQIWNDHYRARLEDLDPG